MVCFFIFRCCCKPKQKNLTEEEKRDIANKRLQYLNSKIVPQKPFNKNNRIEKKENFVNDSKTHEQYIKDLLN